MARHERVAMVSPISRLKHLTCRQMDCIKFYLNETALNYGALLSVYSRLNLRLELIEGVNGHFFAV